MKTSDPADLYHQFSAARAQSAGALRLFVLALAVIAPWAVAGPLSALFDDARTWQLLIITSAAVVALLMVLLIQRAQKRDAEATQRKLDELIRAVSDARNSMPDAKDSSGGEFARRKAQEQDGRMQAASIGSTLQPRQRQFEEYTQPLRVSQRQWT